MTESDTIQRCSICHIRHADAADECPEPGEEGYMSRAELLSAFRQGYGVCLPCQSIWMLDDGSPGPAECPHCGQPCERFGDDDIEEARP